MTNKELERANELNHCIREYEDVKVELENWIKGPKKKSLLNFSLGGNKVRQRSKNLLYGSLIVTIR